MIRSISLRAIVHATEDVERVKRAVQNIASSDVEIAETKMLGHFGNPIVILQTSIEGKKACEGFIKSLKAGLTPEDSQRLKKELEMRVDNDCYLYLRFDKQALYRGSVQLAEGEDAIALRVKIAVYPAKQQNALKVVRGIFS